MGAGRQRWWQAEPFAVAVREDDWNPTKNPTGYSRMVIGGVEIGSAVSDVVEEWMRAINAALPARIVRLEAELEMRRRRDVDRDMELEAGKTLGAVSDEALLNEFERRGAHLEVELYERRNEREGRGRTMEAVRHLYPGMFGAMGRPCMICGHPSDHEGRAHSQSGCIDRQDFGRQMVQDPTGREYYVTRTAWLFRDYTEVWEQRESGNWRLAGIIDGANNANTNYRRGMTATEVAHRRSSVMQALMPALDRWQLEVLEGMTARSRALDRADAMALTFQGPALSTRGFVRVMNIADESAPSPHASPAAVDLAGDPMPATPIERCARKGCKATPTRGKHCAIHQPHRPRR